jgi:hypothetical protein
MTARLLVCVRGLLPTRIARCFDSYAESIGAVIALLLWRTDSTKRLSRFFYRDFLPDYLCRGG